MELVLTQATPVVATALWVLRVHRVGRHFHCDFFGFYCTHGDSRVWGGLRKIADYLNIGERSSSLLILAYF